MTSPALTDEPLDLADVPDLDAVDGTDTELAVEATATESAPAEVPVSETISNDPHALAGRVAETAYQLADTASKLPSLLIQRDDITDKMQDAQREYTAAMRLATETFSARMEPLTDEMKSTDAAIEAATKAKTQLETLASPPK